jgi:rubrerythrin
MPIFPLERLFDPPVKCEKRHREQEAAIRGVKQQDGDPPSGPEDGPRFRCRVCAYESADPEYCPDCIADTMEPVT